MEISKRIYLIVLIILLPITFAADILFGSVSIPFSIFSDILQYNTIPETWHIIITELRIPRAITALITGMALPVSGLLMQTFFRNPLAGPYVLGISTGASLGVAIFSLGGGLGTYAIITGLGIGTSWGMIIAACIGSLAVMFIIVSLSPKVRDTASLLIIGIMLGSITSAVVSVLQYFSNPLEIQEFLMWTFGNFSGLDWTEISIMLGIIIPMLAISFAMQKSLNALLLGENYARGLGVNIKRLRFGIIISASLLAGVITAFTGPIGFVGMAVPHIARTVFKTTNHSILIATSALIGAHLVLLCDIISQLPGYQSTIPINTVTALFGAPIVIFVIFKSRKSQLQY
ncbi:MAG: iron ABC transporter permease [Bacteroidales bacterium]|nr:iron ABC transporter permease [Bacteroidales bacterium]